MLSSVSALQVTEISQHKLKYCPGFRILFVVRLHLSSTWTIPLGSVQERCLARFGSRSHQNGVVRLTGSLIAYMTRA